MSPQVNPLSRIAAMALLLVFPAAAVDPASVALRGALMTASSLPAESAFKARSTAAELLSRYVKIREGNHLSQSKSGTAGMWLEMKGLHLSDVSVQAVTMADKANGIAGSYHVSLVAETYRTYDAKTAKWSNWHNGRYFLLPSAIKVVRGTNGGWAAHAPQLSNFVAFTAHGNPSIIPHGTMPAPTAKPPLAIATAPTRHAFPPASAEPKKIPAPGTAASPAAKMADGIIRFAIVVVLIVVGIPLFFLLVVGTLGWLARPHQLSRPLPPPLPSSSTLPHPPVPADELAYPEIDLMKGNSHLLTPAEQAFHKVLEPLVRNACAISSKVRLADLFSVTPGHGQQAAFNKISRKHIDFVLTEPETSRILCAIELDDSSHNRPDRIERDTFVNELFAVHGMPLLRVPVAWTYNVPGLRTELLKAGVPLAKAA
jgi:hypothetical protein